MKRSIFATVCAFFMLASLSACQTIPEHSKVMPGLSKLSQAEQQVLFNPSGPLPNASQEEIVRGFLEAAAAANSNYEIAREYLTPQYQNSWQPVGVIVDENTRSFSQISDRVTKITTSAIAILSAAGELVHQQPQAQNVDLRFELERYDDEWRISSAPANLVLDYSTFTAVWSKRSLAFVDAAGSIVPDTRWVLNGSGSVTETIEHMLRGPATRLQDVVQSAFGAGVRLTAPVKVHNGRAYIQVSEDFADAPESDMSITRAQLAKTLSNFDYISNFVLSSNGRKITQGKIAKQQASTTSTPAYALTAERILSFDATAATEILALYPTLNKLNPSDITLLPRTTANAEKLTPQMAVLHNGAVSLVSADRVTTLSNQHNNLAPSVDKWAYIWTGTFDGAKTVRAYTANKDELQLDLPANIAHTRLKSVRIAPDGSQLALLVQNGNSSSVYLAGVVRAANGTPLRLTTEAHLTLNAPGTALDLDWLTDGKLALLTHSGDISVTTVGGNGSFGNELTRAPSGRSLAGSTAADVRVLNAEGEVFSQRESLVWNQIASGVRVLIKNN
ncbi:GerMN domain-containing protein [Canibacter sp. lx-45]|uniref:LpqB family beta-propeller domain-containing protein n=1 Tax=Canibacter zhuwentaonis TaxID=2837491 RepID=UPI001BDC8887|nr:LpqB family beta-propeller domain-containing protein [Canibacter zhuwentaonis]MBT1035790.1 GerMN domain-containing protein [Canibacter zhuwentaonis]